MTGYKFSINWFFMVSCFLMVVCSNSQAFEKQQHVEISISSNQDTANLCSSSSNYMACPPFQVYTSNSIMINIRAVLGTSRNVHLESKTNNILSYVDSISPASCSVLHQGDVCSFTLDAGVISATGDVNVFGNGQPLTFFTLEILEG